MRDANYPWFILVPCREDVREIHHLDTADQQQLLRESVQLAQAMEQAFTPDKLNVAALGNMVPQLHVHHVARYRDDPAWPAPVWGRAPARPYAAEQLAETKTRLLAALSAEAGFRPGGD
jgi:diadenosine tetraphosphate (Ap4A) HIT family hydrolase